MGLEVNVSIALGYYLRISMKPVYSVVLRNVVPDMPTVRLRASSASAADASWPGRATRAVADDTARAAGGSYSGSPEMMKASADNGVAPVTSVAPTAAERSVVLFMVVSFCWVMVERAGTLPDGAATESSPPVFRASPATAFVFCAPPEMAGFSCAPPEMAML